MRTVLLIDDDLDALAALGRLLAIAGHKVTTACDGAAAMELLLGGLQPEVILLDLMMPRMDGWSFRIVQARHPVLSKIPVIAMSGDPTPQAEAIDADLFLPKMDMQRIVSAIEEVVSSAERRNLEAARLQQMDRLASLGTLASGMAHEINNPLAVLLSNLDFSLGWLQSGEAVEAYALPHFSDVVDALKEGRNAAERVRSIVRDLKSFSRRDPALDQQCSLRRALEVSIRIAWEHIRYRATLVKDYGPAPTVMGNEGQLSQVFVNLLINAAQAIPEGHVEHNEIRIVTRTDPSGGAVVEVHDTGAGISAEVMRRMFEPFFTTKPVGVGTGLGLWVCNGIVHSMGGAIVAQSAPGRGSVFTVTLPAAKAQPVPQAAARRGRVLVIDDQEDASRAMRRMLTPQHEVIVANTGALALDLLLQEGQQFDAVFCEVLMPDLSGIELHRGLLQRAPELARSIIFMSAATGEPVRSFFDGVENERISKPLEPQAVRALVLARCAQRPAEQRS